MGVSVQSWQRNEGKMKIQILGLIFVGMLPFLVSGTAKAKDGHIMRFGRSVMDQNDMFMRALRSSDMFMRALRSNDGMTRDSRGGFGSSNDMFMRALREDPSIIMSDAIENGDN